jgi:hypothetical protein
MESRGKKYKSLKEFYPYYLEEHQDPTTRKLHFFGTTLVILFLILFFITLNPWYFLCAPVSGYFFAWIGHFFFEKNKPATFKYPGYSLLSDFILFWHILTGKEKFDPR